MSDATPLPAKAGDSFQAPNTAATATVAEEDADATETYNDGDRLACPWCGEVRRDLWDYDWGSREEIEIECGFCDKPVILSRREDVSYSARRVTVTVGDKEGGKASV